MEVLGDARRPNKAPKPRFSRSYDLKRRPVLIYQTVSQGVFS
jgi:hypothetical protein